MQLLSKDLETRFIVYNEEHKGKEIKITGDTPVLVKYFNAMGIGTWYITGAHKEKNGDWKLYGLCEVFEFEVGPVWLSQLQDLQARGYMIERDNFLEDGTTLKEALERDHKEVPSWIKKGK